jgi:hypothetical protein
MISFAAATADVEVSLSVTDLLTGKDLEGVTIPVPGIVANVAGHYKGTNKALALMGVQSRSLSTKPWSPLQVLFTGVIGPDETVEKHFTLSEPGYYMFVWVVLGKWFYIPVRVKIGPVVPTPAPLTALLISTSALGLIFFKKRARAVGQS